jgi:hypothetical protein
VRQRRPELLAVALDLCVPPLSLLVTLTASVLGLGVMGGLLGGSWLPVALAAIATGLVLAAGGLAWLGFGRDGYPFTVFLAVPWYVLRKLPLYLTFLFRRQRAWVRTARGDNATRETDGRSGLEDG